jgi:prepilin-type processing-associated H-X9-DG protein
VGSSTTINGVTTTYRLTYQTGSAFGAWEITEPLPVFRGSYGCNQWLFCDFSRASTSSTGLWGIDFLSLRERDSIPLVFDSADPSTGPTGSNAPSATGRSSTPLLPVERHDGSVNIVFLDWSVRKIGPEEQWTLKWSSNYGRSGS